MPPAAKTTPMQGCTSGGCEDCDDDDESECEGTANKPVFLASGVLAEYHSDLGWAIPRGHLQFRRAYLSNRTRSGQLGVGWAHSFELSIEDGPSGATATDWRGSSLFFARNALGGYDAPAVGGASLVRDADGKWVLRLSTGTENHYRADGKLAMLADSNGNTITMVRSPAGDLVRVEDPAGGALELEVTDGLIRSATAKNGDRVRFAYTSDRRLAVATSQGGQAGHATSYTYSLGAGLLDSIRRPTTGRGSLSQHIQYDVNQRVIRVTSRTGDDQESVNSFGYPDSTTRTFTAADSKTYTFKLSPQGRLVERVDPNGDRYTIELDTAGRTRTRTFPDNTSEGWSYDTAGQLVAYRSRNNEETRIERDPVTGFPTALIRVNGNREEREERKFNAAGMLTLRKNAAGEETRFTVGARGLVTDVRRPGGATTHFEHDASGNILTATDRAGTTTYKRDGLGREIAVTTPGGRTTRTEYCTCGSVSATIDGGGNPTEHETDGLGSTTATVLANGARTEYTHLRRNGFNLVAEVKDALGNVWKTKHDAVGRVVELQDPLGRRTVFTLDDLGRVVRVTFPGGNFSITRYDRAGNVEEIEDARGGKTRFRRDANGRIIETIQADGSTSKQKHDGVGRVVQRVNAENGVEQTVYDGAGRVIATIDAMGHIARTEYGAAGLVTGLVTRTVDTRGKATEFKYDELERLVETTNALGFTSRQEQGPDGEVTLIVNARGAETRFHFDARGHMDESTDALGGKVKKTFDEVGNLARVEDQKQNAWKFRYDLLARRTHEIDPKGGVTQYTFNAVELVRVRHADRSEWHYIYDSVSGRLTTRVIRDPNGKIEDIESFSYDIIGNRIRAENGAMKVTSAYDEMNREVKRTTLWKKTGAVRELIFAWDSMGRRQGMHDTHGRITLYAYDKLSRPVKITVLDPNPRSTSIADAFFAREYVFTWDAINLVQVDYPNGTRTRRVFDDIDRLTTLVHERVRDGHAVELLASWAIQRDKVGNPEKIVRENGEEWKFEHDKLDRLVKAHLPHELVARLRKHQGAKGANKGEKLDGKAKDDDADDDRDDDDERGEKLLRVGEVKYRYDAAHNRTEEIYGGRSILSTFDAANQQLTRGGTSFKYDPRGNQTEKIHKSGRREVFGYSAAGKLASFSTGHVNTAKLKEVERYLHAPDGERVLVETVPGKKLTHALWDGSRQIEEFHEVGHGKGKKEKGLLYTRDLSGQLLEQAKFERQLGVTAHRRPDDDDDDLEEDDDRDERDPHHRGRKLGHVKFIAGNYLGSTALVMNHRGRVLARPEFGPWGELLEGNFAHVKFGYTGHRLEERSGHWSAMHRQLDPRAGRWTQRDPLGDQDGLNLYAYVDNSPVNFVDPFGLLLQAVDPVAQRALDLAEKVPTVKPVIDSVRDDRCKFFTITVLSASSVNLADTGPVGPAARNEYGECCNRAGPKLFGTIKIYAGSRKPGTEGYDLNSADKWNAIRVAHEMWHADTLRSNNEPPDGGYALGTAAYDWFKRHP